MPDRVENHKYTKPIAGMLILACLWSLVIVIQLARKQIIEHEEYKSKANDNYQRERTTPASRGVIYDSHMDALAISVTRKNVIVDPRLIDKVWTECKEVEKKFLEDPDKKAQKPKPCLDIPDVARLLAPVLQVDSRKLQEQMLLPTEEGKYKGKLKSYIPVKVRMGKEMEQALTTLIAERDISGIFLKDVSVRNYPNHELASHLLGFVNREGIGSAGLEQEYEKTLTGTPGLYHIERDQRGRAYKTIVETKPVSGHSLVLSLNKAIQHTAYSELAAGVEKAQAQAGTAIVMESATGRILALANYPQFDGNEYEKYPRKRWLNRAVSDMFEPGSTFKVAVAASALKAGVARYDEMIDCRNGVIQVGGHTFREQHHYGLIPFPRILEVSSNVGSIVLGLRLGPERLYESLRLFGFGSRTGIDLPAESPGHLRDWHKWSGLSIGAISFGHEVGVTSMQILTAVNTIASGGYRVRPSVVDRVIDGNGDLVAFHQPEKVRILESRTAEEIASALEGVVLKGTAKRAALSGYSAAGKTGTAQKVVTDPVTGKKRYSKSKYVGSFIGFAPVKNPRITVLVQMDEPGNGYYGGTVSAPVFQKIAQDALVRLKVEPDLLQPAYPVPVKPAPVRNDTAEFRPDDMPETADPVETWTERADNQPRPGSVARPALPASPEGKNLPGIITVELENPQISVPDFSGMSKRKVLHICTDLNIQLLAQGSGIAVAQNPPPGARVAAGATCTVTFAKAVGKELARSGGASGAVSGLRSRAAMRE